MKQKEKKTKIKDTNKYKYIIISTIIFLIINFLITKGLYILDEKLLITLLNKNQYLYLITYHSIWTIINVLQLLIIYKFISKMKLNTKDTNIVKNINTILFLLIGILLNVEQLNEIIFYNIKLVSILILIKTTILWFLSIHIFEKKYKCEKLKKDLISLIISVIVIFTAIFLYEYIQYEKTTLVCTRKNGDLTYIRVGEYGVENIKINGEFLDEQGLTSYNTTLLLEFINNINKNNNKEKIIKANMKSVNKYEEEHESKCETIR